MNCFLYGHGTYVTLTSDALITLRGRFGSDNVRGPHSFHRREERVGGTDRDHFSRFVSVGDEIAQIVLGRPARKSLLGHPEIVVHF